MLVYLRLQFLQCLEFSWRSFTFIHLYKIMQLSEKRKYLSIITVVSLDGISVYQHRLMNPVSLFRWTWERGLLIYLFTTIVTVATFFTYNLNTKKNLIRFLCQQPMKRNYPSELSTVHRSRRLIKILCRPCFKHKENWGNGIVSTTVANTVVE